MVNRDFFSSYHQTFFELGTIRSEVDKIMLNNINFVFIAIFYAVPVIYTCIFSNASLSQLLL